LSLSSRFGFAAMTWRTSSNVETRSPSISRIRSPGSSFPSAGLPGTTTPTVGGRNCVSSRKTDV